MEFKIFPCQANKEPVQGFKWKTQASRDAEQIKLWQGVYGEQIKLWAIPTGKDNDLFVLDADVKTGGLETIKTLEIPETRTQRTQSGGLHFFFRYPKDGRHYGNKVGLLPGLDVRGEGGYVCFYGDDGKDVADAPSWLVEKMFSIPESVVQQAGVLPVKVPPEIAITKIKQSIEAIREAAPGESNNILNIESFKVGQLVASASVTYDYAFEALFNAARERGKPIAEAKATIASGLSGGNKKPMTSPFGDNPPAGFVNGQPFTVNETRWTPAKFDNNTLQDVSKLRKPQLFKDWSTEDIHITTADGGTGKTTLKLYEAVCLALGAPFLGFESKAPPGSRTLFITGEDTREKLGAMLGVIMKQMGLYDNRMPGNPQRVQMVLDSVFVKKDADMTIVTRDRSGFYYPNPPAMKKIMQAIEDLGPFKLIVLDPIASFWGSEAGVNDMAKAVSKFVGELVERTGACVEMINHMGKQSSNNKDMSQFAGRGGTGLPSHARVSRVLRPVMEDEFQELTGEALKSDQSAMMCRINKFTDGSPLYNKDFLIIREGFLFTRRMLSEQKQREVEKQNTDNERVFTFIKEQRRLDRYPTKKVVLSYFKTCIDPISDKRVDLSLSWLGFHGLMGECIKFIDNPDLTINEKAIVIADMKGVEV